MISPIENSGIISRSQDISIVNHNENSRSQAEHVTIQERFDNQQDEQSRIVISTGNSSETDTHHDARDKSRNEYVDNRKKTKKAPAKPEEKVVLKGYKRFDITI